MYNIIKVSMVAGILFLGAGVASAASIPAFYDAIFDGETTAWGNPGDDVSGEIFVEVEDGEFLYAFSTDVIGDGLPRQCHTDFNIVQGEQSATLDFDHELGPNTGERDFIIDGFTAANANEADARRDVGDGCNSTSDEMYNENDVINIVPGGSSNDDDDNDDLGDDNTPSWFQKLLDLLKPATPTTPTASVKCAAVNAKLLGTVDNTYNNANVMLQGYLLSEGMSIPALAAGASFGYKGPQTNAALSQFKSANQCI